MAMSAATIRESLAAWHHLMFFQQLVNPKQEMILTVQVAERIRVDDRLTIIERTNLRYSTPKDMPSRQPVQLATLDLSFISVLKVLPAVCSVLSPDAQLIVLIKPQFEAGKSEVRHICRPVMVSQ